MRNPLYNNLDETRFKNLKEIKFTKEQHKLLVNQHRGRFWFGLGCFTLAIFLVILMLAVDDFFIIFITGGAFAIPPAGDTMHYIAGSLLSLVCFIVAFLITKSDLSLYAKNYSIYMDVCVDKKQAEFTNYIIGAYEVNAINKLDFASVDKGQEFLFLDSGNQHKKNINNDNFTYLDKSKFICL
jgi:hypothetical protein